MKKDVENFRKQMNMDYIEIMLMHCMTNSKWPQKRKGPMDVLSKLYISGFTIGCSDPKQTDDIARRTERIRIAS